MHITSLEIYKGKTYCIELDNRKKVFLHSDIVNSYCLSEGMEIDNEELENIIRNAQFRKARERALYLLDYRDHSYIELLEKLEKNYDEDICYDVADSLAEKGLINDRRYAENLAAKLIETKKYGIYKARYEMKAHGLSKELVDKTLAGYEDNTYERLAELIEKKYARYLTDFKGIQKVKNALIRLGYSYDDINAAIDDYIDE